MARIKLIIGIKLLTLGFPESFGR